TTIRRADTADCTRLDRVVTRHPFEPQNHCPWALGDTDGPLPLVERRIDVAVRIAHDGSTTPDARPQRAGHVPGASGRVSVTPVAILHRPSVTPGSAAAVRL